MKITKDILKWGISSSIIACICTILFAIFLFPKGMEMYAYFVCIILSFSIVIMTVALKHTLDEEKSFHSSLAVIFSIMYCLLVSIVYYIQISFVRLGDLSIEQLSIVAYAPPGTAFFALDMLGYFFLCIATLFIAFAMDKKEKILRILLFIHALMAPTTFAFPLLPFVYEKTTETATIDGGVIALAGWCVIFVPICILVANYFIKKNKEIKN